MGVNVRKCLLVDLIRFSWALAMGVESGNRDACDVFAPSVRWGKQVQLVLRMMVDVCHCPCETLLMCAGVWSIVANVCKCV